LAALRFFYCKTLKKGWNIAQTPYPKREHRLPGILSREEVARLIQAAGTAFHRTLLMTLYATGVRNAELTHLKFSDVDKQRLTFVSGTSAEDSVTLETVNVFMQFVHS
jgi:site-specific recombinase XerD